MQKKKIKRNLGVMLDIFTTNSCQTTISKSTTTQIQKKCSTVLQGVIIFLTSVLIYCGVHTVAADPVTSVQQPNIRVQPLSQALVSPLPATNLGSTDSARIVGNQLRNAYEAAVEARQGILAGSSAGRQTVSGGATAPSGSWVSKSQKVSAASIYKAQPTVQNLFTKLP